LRLSLKTSSTNPTTGSVFRSSAAVRDLLRIRLEQALNVCAPTFQQWSPQWIARPGMAIHVADVADSGSIFSVPQHVRGIPLGLHPRLMAMLPMSIECPQWIRK
jgi:hypothetical protein